MNTQHTTLLVQKRAEVANSQELAPVPAAKARTDAAAMREEARARLPADLKVGADAIIFEPGRWPYEPFAIQIGRVARQLYGKCCYQTTPRRDLNEIHVVRTQLVPPPVVRRAKRKK